MSDYNEHLISQAGGDGVYVSMAITDGRETKTIYFDNLSWEVVRNAIDTLNELPVGSLDAAKVRNDIWENATTTLDFHDEEQNIHVSGLQVIGNDDDSIAARNAEFLAQSQHYEVKRSEPARTEDFQLTELYGWYDGTHISKRLINCQECGCAISYDSQVLETHRQWHNNLLP